MGGIIEAFIAVAALSATVAEVATVAVVVGTTLSVAGAVTGNKTLSMVGMGLGIAGGIGGLAAANGLFGASESAGFFGGAGVAESAPVGTTAADVGATPTASGWEAPTGQGFNGEVGAIPQGGETVQPGITSEAGATTPTTASIGEAAPTLTPSPIGEGPATGSEAWMQANAPPAPSAPVSPTVEAPMPQPTGVSPSPTVQPTSGAPFSIGANGAVGAPPVAPGTPGWAANFMNNTPAADLPNALANLDPTSKAALLMAGGQAVSGGVGGIFTGMTADKQMALQTWMANQNASQFNQQFKRGNSAGGLINFASPASGPAGKVA